MQRPRPWPMTGRRPRGGRSHGLDFLSPSLGHSHSLTDKHMQAVHTDTLSHVPIHKPSRTYTLFVGTRQHTIRSFPRAQWHRSACFSKLSLRAQDSRGHVRLEAGSFATVHRFVVPWWVLGLPCGALRLTGSQARIGDGQASRTRE
jgi:hypothetical protein